jgi:L-cystine uptake protein TcyP (sodium:dicarboxylate symporter family)
MNVTFLVIRALAVEFARRLYKPIVITVVIVAILLLTVTAWLTTVSDLWWVLMIFLVFIVMIVAILLTIVWLLLRALSPTQTKQQRKQATALVDKMMRVAEITATPKFVLLFQVAKDAFVPNKGGFISSVIGDTGTLQKDFIAFRDTFK